MSDRELTPQELAKIEADTALVTADLMLRQADLRLKEQEIITKKLDAELHAAEVKAKTDKVITEAALQVEALAQAKYGTAHMERTEREVLADDKYNHTYYFNTSVGDASSRACMQRLSYWDRLDPLCDMEIVFNSPGGSVIDGLALFDFIQELKRKGHKVTTKSLGMAASMAGILLQAGNDRVMAAESWVLIHEISTAAIGKIGEIEDEVKFVKRIQERVLKIFADGCAAAHKRDPKMHPRPLTISALRKGWTRKDWWLDSTECQEHGLIDRID